METVDQLVQGMLSVLLRWDLWTSASFCLKHEPYSATFISVTSGRQWRQGHRERRFLLVLLHSMSCNTNRIRRQLCHLTCTWKQCIQCIPTQTQTIAYSENFHASLRAYNRKRWKELGFIGIGGNLSNTKLVNAPLGCLARLSSKVTPLFCFFYCK